MKKGAIAAALLFVLVPVSAAAQDGNGERDELWSAKGDQDELWSAKGDQDELWNGDSDTSSADPETLGQMISATNSGLSEFGGYAKNGAPFKAMGKALLVSDIATGVVAPWSEGDGRGAISGAVNIAINNTVVSTGAAAMGAVGAVVGSVVPFAGTAAGAAVGGAIGAAAGGFITSIAFDRFGKSVVAKVVEGAIASVMDPDPLDKAMKSRDEYLRAQAAPELQRAWNDLHAVSAGFGGEEVEAVGPGTTPYIVQNKGWLVGAPASEAPAPSEGAASSESAAASDDVLAGVRRFEAEWWVPGYPQSKSTYICEVNGGNFVCRGDLKYECSRFTQVISGTVQGGHLDGTSVHEGQAGTCSACTTSERGVAHATIELTADGKSSGEVGPGNWNETSMTGSCGNRGLIKSTSPGGKLEGSWRKLG